MHGQRRSLRKETGAARRCPGTSVGSLNGAVLADTGDVGAAAEILDQVWRGLTTASVFPGNRIAQGWRVVRGQTVFPDDGQRAGAPSL